ncbi:hypothetical protein ACVIW0_001586 [Bradyrhizobium sp. USDA 4454]
MVWMLWDVATADRNVLGRYPIADRSMRAAEQFLGSGRVELDPIKPAPAVIDCCWTAAGMDCSSRKRGRGGTIVAVVCHVEHPLSVGRFLVPRSQRGAWSLDAVERALASQAACPCGNGMTPEFARWHSDGPAALGQSIVPIRGSMKWPASHAAQATGGTSLGCVRQQSLSSLARIWIRKEDRAPRLSICHVSELDWNVLSISSRHRCIDAGQKEADARLERDEGEWQLPMRCR